MAKVFSGIYGGGKSTELGVGTHYLSCRSIHLGEHETARVFENKDGSGQKTRWLYGSGKYEDTGVYGCHIGQRVEIGHTQYADPDFVILYWNADVGTGRPFPCMAKLEPGREYCADPEWMGRNAYDLAFPDNKVERIHVPGDVTVQLYDIPGNYKSGPYIEIDKGPADIDLAELGYKGKPSYIKCSVDEWLMEAAELLFDEGDMQTSQSEGERLKATNTLDVEANIGGEVDVTVQESMSFSWELNWNISVSTSVKVFGSGVDIGLSLGGSVGGSKETSISRTIMQSASVPVPPGETVYLSLVVTEMKGVVPTRYTLVNKRTGAKQITQGTTDLALATESEVRFDHA